MSASHGEIGIEIVTQKWRVHYLRRQLAIEEQKLEALLTERHESAEHMDRAGRLFGGEGARATREGLPNA